MVQKFVGFIIIIQKFGKKNNMKKALLGVGVLFGGYLLIKFMTKKSESKIEEPQLKVVVKDNCWDFEGIPINERSGMDCRLSRKDRLYNIQIMYDKLKQVSDSPQGVYGKYIDPRDFDFSNIDTSKFPKINQKDFDDYLLEKHIKENNL